MIVGIVSYATQAAAPTSDSKALLFRGLVGNGILPWQLTAGGAQCANYGTRSVHHRLRGSLYFTKIDGLYAAQFYDGVNSDPVQWYDQNCELVGPLSGNHELRLPADEYVGLSVYIPRQNVIPNRTGATNIAEFHMQDVGGQPPLALSLHRRYVAVDLDVGAYSSAGFQYARYGRVRLPRLYAIPPGALVPGAWNEIVFHAHWADDSTGALQFYYKAKGAKTWNRGSSISGVPTISWYAQSQRPALTRYSDAIGNYGAAFNSPFSIYESHVLDGTSLAAVEASMP